MELNVAVKHPTTIVIAALPQFDLTRVRSRVEGEYPELTSQKIDEIETKYRQFLLLCKNERSVRNKPSKEVDLIWHMHILHTKQYMEDCQSYFGYYLHHHPNLTDCEDGGDPCFA